MELSIQQKQQHKLGQQMELSVRILQMDNLQLTEYLKEMMLENPVVDLEGAATPDPPDSHRELALRKAEWLERQSFRIKENIGYYEDHGAYVEKIAGVYHEETLADHLLEQARICGCPTELLPAVQFLIGCLDDNGYLSEPLDNLAAQSPHPLDGMEQALQILQTFEPAGVGARNLRECLLLQLPQEDKAARLLVDKHLKDMVKNDHAALAKKIDLDAAGIREAVMRIRQLTPKPGAAYHHDTILPYITPDVVVTTFKEHYHVMLCEFGYPQVRMNTHYLDMLGHCEDQETVAYIKQKVEQIHWVQTCIQNRGETLSRVAKAIVKRQERFFRHGPRHLAILRMKDIADMLEIHESTVSRAVRDKYIQCAHGVYPLRFFFVQGVAGLEERQGASSHSIKERIRDLIAAEPSHKPLSDQQLSNTLTGEGVPVSRRTVAKYRESMNIPASFKRAHKQ